MKQREGIWDFIKGMAILIVIFGHSIGGWDFEAWDYYVPVNSFNFNSWFTIRTIAGSWIIGVFFFISGYMLSGKKERAFDYYKKRGNRIVVPYLIWSGIYTIVNLLVYKQDVSFVSFLLGTNGIQLYFFVVSIQFMILTPLLTTIKNKKIMLYICMAITLLNNIWQLTYWMKHKCMVPNEMILCTCFIGYYYLGYYFKTAFDTSRLASSKSKIAAASFMAVACIILLAESYWRLSIISDATVAMSLNSPVNILFTVSVILFIMSFKDLYKTNIFTRKIEWIGFTSMDFFAVHWLLMRPMKLWIQNNIPSEYMWFSCIALMVVTFVACFLFVIAKQHIKDLLLPVIK